MHPVRLYELPDGGIDERISCLSSLKHFPLVARLISLPVDTPSALLKLDLIGKGEIIRDMIPELSPDEFTQKGF